LLDEIHNVKLFVKSCRHVNSIVEAWNALKVVIISGNKGIPSFFRC